MITRDCPNCAAPNPEPGKGNLARCVQCGRTIQVARPLAGFGWCWILLPEKVVAKIGVGT